MIGALRAMKEIREFIATDIDSDAVYSLVRTAGGKMFVEVFYSEPRALDWESPMIFPDAFDSNSVSNSRVCRGLGEWSAFPGLFSAVEGNAVTPNRQFILHPHTEWRSVIGVKSDGRFDILDRFAEAVQLGIGERTDCQRLTEPDLRGVGKSRERSCQAPPHLKLLMIRTVGDRLLSGRVIARCNVSLSDAGQFSWPHDSLPCGGLGRAPSPWGHAEEDLSFRASV